MFCLVPGLFKPRACRISSYGHVALGDPGYRSLTQAEFIRDFMSVQGRRDLFGSEPPWSEEDIILAAEQWERKTGIRTRNFFSGSTAKLGAIAAQKCLQTAGVQTSELDAIVAGTNTGPGYPSLADYIKLALGQESEAMAYDVAEACPVGAIVVFNGWNMIVSGAARKVLVVCAEKASTLTIPDDWRASNLFGDGAFAFLLTAADSEAFIFFDFQSLPFGGNIAKIIKSDIGIQQDGNAVHKFVGRQVVNSLVEAVAKAGIDPADINHLVPHQPSGQTLDLFFEKIKASWPTFRGQMHRQVEWAGNTSGASTGTIISQGIKDGVIKKNDLVLVTTFGAGLAIGSYAFRV